VIRAGALADFVLLRGNPLEDIAWINQIELVIRRGEVFRREDLLGE
jgi:imidazolonepropionase-like amidohydrolase